ncbi:SGNH/GDSL hydrolase family protein [Streptomyces sp. NPDC005808]|uniref:SGNH/GDSL hydrolase family protein n=1 Tax=Streptomyces sp. NPDC005808 TaxID=3364734 RepID=UPI003681DE23
MTKPRGYALLAGIIAVVLVVSAAIFVGVAGDEGGGQSNLAGARSPRGTAAPVSTDTWVGAWAASPAGAEPGTDVNGMAGRSVRNVVHTSTGGRSARITLSNLYGRQPLAITHATIAVAETANSAAAEPGTMARLTFGGNTSVVIPPGQQVLSDAVNVRVPGDSDLLVTTFSPTRSGPVTFHPHARQISYVAAGDLSDEVSGVSYTEETRYWRYLTAVDVLSGESVGTIVALGDSLTDGGTATVGANHRYPDYLSDRLRAAAGTDGAPRYSVVNEGMGGNQLLTSRPGSPAENPSALSRFGRDVLGRPNVKAVVIDLGINDLLRNPSRVQAKTITDGLRTLVRQAHAHGIIVIGATLMPFKGAGGYTDQREAVRQAINAEIRTGKVFDAVVDFDEALQDPYDPRRLRPDYDSGDHLHPSDQGNERMAEVFDLGALSQSVTATM